MLRKKRLNEKEEDCLLLKTQRQQAPFALLSTCAKEDMQLQQDHSRATAKHWLETTAASLFTC
jgi:hypothetical protein